MPQLENTYLADHLRSYIYSNGLKKKQRELAGKIGITYQVLYGFLKGKNPHHENKEAIECFLKEEGVITRFGFPTQPPSQPEPLMTDVDKEQLRAMDIRPYEPITLSENEKRFLTYALYHAHGNQEQKDALLEKILSQFSL